MTIRPELMPYLRKILDTGLYGTTLEEVGNNLMAAKIEHLVRSRLIALQQPLRPQREEHRP